MTTGAFAPVLHNGFVNFDDPDAIINNTFLQSPAGLRWAWTTTHMSHYQPLSWVAWWFAADTPAQPLSFHHLSLFVHLFNAALVFLLAWQLSRAAGLEGRTQLMIATVGSAAFAIHPLRVEPVAWASAFPYLLALCFALISVVSYVASVSATHPASGRVWYLMSLASYLLSLLSRVAIPGLPFILLILDVYPLGLLQVWGPPSGGPGPAKAGPHKGSNERTRQVPPNSARSVLAAKLPYLLLAVIFVFIESQTRDVAGLDEVSLGTRLTMAVSAPFVYLWHTVAPV